MKFYVWAEDVNTGMKGQIVTKAYDTQEEAQRAAVSVEPLMRGSSHWFISTEGKETDAAGLVIGRKAH